MFLGRVIRYLWASPASVLGLLAGTSGGWRATWTVIDGVIEIEGPVIAWGLRYLTLLPGGASALTLGHVVLGRDARTLDESRDHEHVHVRQYEVWGPFFFPAYAVASAMAAFRGRHYYYDNAFEQEAYSSDAERVSSAGLQTVLRCAAASARFETTTRGVAGQERLNV